MLVAAAPVWREWCSSGRVFRPDPGPSVPDVAEGPEVAKAVLVEQLGAEAEEGDGNDAEDGDDDRQGKRHSVTFLELVGAGFIPSPRVQFAALHQVFAEELCVMASS